MAPGAQSERDVVRASNALHPLAEAAAAGDLVDATGLCSEPGSRRETEQMRARRAEGTGE